MDSNVDALAGSAAPACVAASGSANLQEASAKVARALENVVKSEMACQEEDLTALADINTILCHRYDDLVEQTQEVKKAVGEVKDQYDELGAYFVEIDAAERAVSELETMVRSLDAYTRQLQKSAGLS